MSELRTNSGVSMKISSPQFGQNQAIPIKFTCQGDNINPSLKFESVNSSAKSLALIVDDPDAPSGSFTHWMLANIDPQTTEINEGSIPDGAVQGNNDSGSLGYTGPCPPTGEHRYYFKVYALENELNLSDGFSRQELEQAIDQEKIEEAHLIGLYQKK